MIFSKSQPDAKKIIAAYDRFGIDKLSYSTIARAKDSTASWLIKLNDKRQDTLGMPAHIGNAFEVAVVAGANNHKLSMDKCVQFAADYLHPHLIFTDGAEREKILRETASRVITGVEQIRPLGKPDMPDGWYPGSTEWEHQRYFEYDPDWSPKPIKLWADLVYDDTGIMVDLKAPTNKPQQSKIDDYLLQGALYTHGTNYSYKILVGLKSVNNFKDQRFSWHDLDDPATHLNRAKHYIGAMSKILTLGNTIEEICEYIIPDPAHYRLNGPIVRENLKQLFNI